MQLLWPEFGILFAASLVGSAAVLPYGLRLLPKDKPLKFSKPVLFLLSIIQGAVLFALVIGLGLMAAHAIGLGAPYIEAVLIMKALPAPIGLIVALVLGSIAGGVLLIADLCFVPYWPQALRDTALKTTLLENFLASFYGGINEELLVRLFGFSVLAWLLLFVMNPTLLVFWISNIIMTVVFGLGHLPALKKLLGSIPRAMFFRSISLNAPLSLLCGWLFWTYGIEAAAVAHFSADIVYHVLGTLVLRYRLRLSTAAS
jgi:hypothetical protein